MSLQKRALVTGCCGFIGSNLVHRLNADGWLVDGVDDMSNGSLELLNGLTVRTVPAGLLHIFDADAANLRTTDTVLVVEGDFASPPILEKIKAGYYDVIYHLAANPRVEYSVQNPISTTENNVMKTVSLLTAAVNTTRRVVFASSSAAYGDAEQLPTSEACPTRPESPYALQKLVCEDFGRLFARLYNLDIVSLRFFNVYGPNENHKDRFHDEIMEYFNISTMDEQKCLDIYQLY